MYFWRLNSEQSTFTQASFSSVSNIHEYLGGLQMAISSLHAADCDSGITWPADVHWSHDWLNQMRLAMDLAALCDM